MTPAAPAIQLIANLVVRRADGCVLFLRYDPDDERWWLPGGDLEPYEHPDERVARVVADLPGLRLERSRMTHVESFRGRRGWHIVFHYLVDAAGDVAGGPPASWHSAESLPPTAHGPWEADAVARALAAGRG